MLTLIIGGAASGKSEYAERLAAAAPGPRVYLATMRRHDAECEARIEKHRAARAGRGFVTCEREAGLSGLALPAGTRTVLLEDLGNLAANELYGGAGEGAFDAALAGIDELCARAARVYVVSNEVFSDGAPYDPGTRRYIELLGALNRALAARADRVVEVVCGIPLIWKGGTTE